MTPIAKRELMFAGSFGLAGLLCGMVFIRRNAGAKAGQEMNKVMDKLKKENTKLWVFPEGTRRNTGQIHQFKKGAFHAAIQAQVPIVPVVFSSYRSFLDAEKKVFNDGEVIVEALPEISTAGMTSADVDKLIEQTRSAMIDIFDRNSSEVYKRAAPII